MKPRVLFILHLPPPIHGAALVGQYIKESEVINDSFLCDYVNLSTSTYLNEIGKGGIAKIFSLIKIQLKILKLAFQNRYDLCYITITAATPGFYKDFLILLIVKFFGVKTVFHFHNKGVDTCSKKGLNKFLYKFAFNKSKIILLSKNLYGDIARFVKQQNVFYCANGIPALNIAGISGKNNDDEKPIKLLFLSNIMMEKGVMILLEACRNLKERKYDFECHFVGSWSDISENQFRLIVHKYDLVKHVFAHGPKYGDEKIAFFTLADIFVFPTYYHNECFPLVLLEAMQYGLPVISTPEGGIADIVINGETGILVEQKNVLGLTSAIETLKNNKRLRTKMGGDGKKRFDNLFTIHDFEINLLNILKKII